MRLATILILSAAVLAVLLKASCGSSAGDDPVALITDGDAAMNSGDDRAAVVAFEDALKAIGGDTSHPQYFQARFKSAMAAAKVMPEKAKEILLALAKELPDKVTAKEYQQVAKRMAEGPDGLGPAVGLIQEALKRFPDSDQLTSLVDKLGKMAEGSGASEALEALKGLGYVGG